jgi:hypothetical protein
MRAAGFHSEVLGSGSEDGGNANLLQRGFCILSDWGVKRLPAGLITEEPKKVPNCIGLGRNCG